MTPLHIVTCEYPPQIGGVSDYTCQIAEALARLGEEVHVWCPPVNAPREVSAVHIHPELGRFHSSDLQRTSVALDAFPSPRRLVVQWVPHGYGCRSMNVRFCLWLARRAAHGDIVELMVHEPFIEMTWRPMRHAAIAIAHRLMAMILMNAASRVWVSIPAWQSKLRPYAVGRPVSIEWLPIPAAIETSSPIVASSIREKYVDDPQPLLGHFGSYGNDVSSLLEERLPAIMECAAKPALLLIGARSDAFRNALIARHSNWSARVHATGYIATADLGHYIGACDLMLQPYPDGITSRRTSAMAGLSLGRPMVTTAGHLTEPLWAESGAVALANVSDVDSFAAAVIDLIADVDARFRLGDQGKRVYRERFSLSRVIDALASRDRALVSLPSCA
jgi:glycosyltransferase involved in cell wall biosynthesis